jgi:hypothetical protein
MRWMGLLPALCVATCQVPFATAADREARERAVTAIRALGGKVEVDPADPERPVVKVSFRNTKVTDMELSHLAALTELADLDLSHTDITNDGLRHVRGLTHLSKLNLSFNRVTDEGLAHLTGASKLKWLDLKRGCKDVDHYISDSGLRHLKRFGGLEYLNLDWNNVTDAGLEHLKGLSGLREVTLGSGRYTPTGVKGLRQALPKAKIAP